MPVWETDRSIYETILKELKCRAWTSLKELGVLTVDRRHSDSDCGDDGDYPVMVTGADKYLDIKP